MLNNTNNKSDTRMKYLIGLIIMSVIYIAYFAHLNFFYDWDTLIRALWLKQGMYAKDAGVIHFLVSIVANILIPLGYEPLDAFRVFTSLFMFVFVIGTYEFARRETDDDLLAFMIGAFILINFGYTFLLTSLEDNIWMYQPLIFFIYFLYVDRWAVSAFFLSFGILTHIQCEVFIPWILLYMGKKSDFAIIFKNKGITREIGISFLNVQMRKFITAIFFLLMPLLAAYSYLFFMHGWKLNNLLEGFTASGRAYHGDPQLWFFSSNTAIMDQLKFIYYGYVSVFVCRYPDFLGCMPQATFMGGFLAILILYVLFSSFSINLKTLCALPTFLILLVHTMVFEPWNIERMDFLPFFVAYFAAVGYSLKADKAKESIRIGFALILVFSSAFTFASFNSLCGFQESPLCAYGDKLGTLIDNQSVAIETTLRPDSEYGLYLRYQCNDSIMFANPEKILINNFTQMKIYTSNSSFRYISNIFPGVQWDKELIWQNKMDKGLSIIRIKPQYTL